MVIITLSHRIYLDSIIIHELVGNHVATTLSMIKGPNRRYSVSTNGTSKAEKVWPILFTKEVPSPIHQNTVRCKIQFATPTSSEKGKKKKVHEFRISFLTNLWANFQVIILIISLNLLYSILFSYPLSSLIPFFYG